MQTGEIEIAPLAFMRGRTLANAVVILDEAQNTTSMQMKMFLTRLGENSRMIVTGDPSQVDLPPGQTSGLAEAMRLLAASRASATSPSPPTTWSATNWWRASSRPTTRPTRAGARPRDEAHGAAAGRVSPQAGRERAPIAAARSTSIVDIVVESARRAGESVPQRRNRRRSGAFCAAAAIAGLNAAAPSLLSC